MSEKTISEGQYRYLKRKLNELSRQLSTVNFKLNQMKASRRKHLLSFEEVIPPKSVCVDALSMLGVGNYHGMLRLLGDYYGIVRMGFYQDPEKVPENAIACYHRNEGTAYSKLKTITTNTALHELFHHLVTNQVVMLHEGDDEEVLATKYAELFLQRGG